MKPLIGLGLLGGLVGAACLIALLGPSPPAVVPHLPRIERPESGPVDLAATPAPFHTEAIAPLITASPAPAETPRAPGSSSASRHQGPGRRSQADRPHRTLVPGRLTGTVLGPSPEWDAHVSLRRITSGTRVSSRDFEQSDQGVCDSHGRFTIDHLTPGSYEVRARVGGVAITPVVRVEVLGGRTSDVLLQLDTLRVTVVILDATDGRPVEGVKIANRLSTDALGEFVLERQTPGRRKLGLQHPDYVSQNASIVITRSTQRLVFSMRRATRLRGRVLDVQGEPMRVGTVVVLRDDLYESLPPEQRAGRQLLQSVAVRTDRTYIFHGLAPSAYTVLVAPFESGMSRRRKVEQALPVTRVSIRPDSGSTELDLWTTFAP